MPRRNATPQPSERTMTKRDWEALYLAHRLTEQIVLYGADALDTFIDAIAAARSTPTEATNANDL